MDEATFKHRTKQLGLGIIQLAARLPRQRTVDLLCRQLVRSATSLGANYRAACRGKSRADILSKLAIVEEEADETLYWLELLTETGILARESAEALMLETNEILAMTIASIKTLRRSKI